MLIFNTLAWIVTPISGAVIGYFTNWLAIKMLFRPHSEKRFLGVTMPFTPGLIPKERFALSKKVGETLTNNVLTDEVLINSLSSPEFLDKFNYAIDEMLLKLQHSEQTVDELLATLLGEEKEDIFNKAEQLIRTQIIDVLPETFVAEIKKTVTAKVPDLAQFLKGMSEKNSGFDDKMRKLVSKIAAEQFGKFVGIFVNYDKIYDRIKENLFEYLSESGNQQILSEKACGLIDELLQKDINSIYKKLPNYTADLRDKILQQKIGGLFIKLSPDSKIKIRTVIVKAFRFALEKGGAYAVSSLDLAGIVEEKINAFSVEEAEEIILSVVSRELKMITVLGGVLGFIIGLVPAIINSF